MIANLKGGRKLLVFQLAILRGIIPSHCHQYHHQSGIYCSIFQQEEGLSFPHSAVFRGSCVAAAAIIFWRIQKLDLELLAHRSEEGNNPSSIYLIWAHISAIYSSDLASNLYFLADQGSNPGEVIFPKLQTWKIFSGLSWESITVARSWTLASSKL